LALAERFGQAPHTVQQWPAETLRLLEIEHLGRPEEEDPDGHGQ
jgi:hypothetical protein